MKTINNFPDLGRHFQMLKIKLDLEAIVPMGTFTVSIVGGVRDGKLAEVIQMIKQQAKTDRSYMVNLIGEPLLKSIENL